MVPGPPPPVGAGLCLAFGALPRPLPFPRAGRRHSPTPPHRNGHSSASLPPSHHQTPPKSSPEPPNIPHRCGGAEGPCSAPPTPKHPPEPNPMGLILSHSFWEAPPPRPGWPECWEQVAGAGCGQECAGGGHGDPRGDAARPLRWLRVNGAVMSPLLRHELPPPPLPPGAASPRPCSKMSSPRHLGAGRGLMRVMVPK